MQTLIQAAGPWLWLLVVSSFALAQEEVKPAAGTLAVGKRTYQFKYALAYETKDDDETYWSLLASDRKLPIDTIKAALKEDDGDDKSLSLSQPYVWIKLKPTGEVVRAQGAADSSSFMRSSLTGNLKLDAGRMQGKVSLLREDKGTAGFDLEVNVPLGLDAVQPVAKPAGPVKPTVTGTFQGNGKPAKLAYVSARPGKPFSDKPSIDLIFTELDHSKVKDPGMKASFGDFGSALILSLHEDGKIFSCQVAHKAHQKGSFSAIGSVYTASFDLSEGRLEGALKTEEEEEFFGQTWSVDLKFAVPYVAPKTVAPKPVAPSVKPPVAAVPQPTTRPTPKLPVNLPGMPKLPAIPAPLPAGAPAAPAVAALNIADVALPQSATNLQYKKLVEHFEFISATASTTLVAEWSKLLATQGWKVKGSDLVTAKSSILHRTRGGAELTIFVKAEGTGSTARVISKGLDWAEKTGE